ncbi:Fc.00g097810.m01.CDS01 [Cosmosporella sp. VM-42]
MNSFWMINKTIYNKIISKQQIRRLSLHEYQSQNLLREFGLPVPRGRVAQSPADVKGIIKELEGKCILKSQVLKGGRGKGQFDNGLKSGMHIVNSPEEGEEMATKMLGHRLKTEQTYGNGLTVRKIYVSEAIEFDKEWYLGLTIDRENYSPAIAISKRGGVCIEQEARDHPEKVFTFGFGFKEGITEDLVARISRCVNISVQQSKDLEVILKGLFRIFTEKDATLLEVSPLVRRSKDGALVCLDAKFTFDNAAEKRQAELFALRDPEHEIQEEVEAEKYGLVYVRMDGNIGNVVNGAGLAMATNDAISLYGGSSANFLDAGGQATKETMQQAFRIIISDQRVKAILVNIYGGITRCDMIAESIIGAASELGPMRVPVVVRLQGTNSAEGLEILERANLGLYVEAGFGEAAKKAVELANSESIG